MVRNLQEKKRLMSERRVLELRGLERRRSPFHWVWACSSVFLSVDAFTVVQQLNQYNRARNDGASEGDSSLSAESATATAVTGHENLNNDTRQISPSSSSVAHFHELPARFSDCTADQVDHEVRLLEYTMLERGFQIEDVRMIVREIFILANGDNGMSTGLVNFLKVILSLTDTEAGRIFFQSTAVLRACIVHYSHCLVAPGRGIPCALSELLTSPRDGTIALSSDFCTSDLGTSFSNALVVASLAEFSESTPLSSSWEEEVERIVDGAARIKRAELLVKTLLKDKAASSHDDVRNFLVSVTTDWRSLGIRVVTCLSQLEGSAVEWGKGGEYRQRTPEIVHTAREALKIYAPLAQRLGLHSLKSRIEANAFRILYRRQYEAAASIFREGGEAMHALSNCLQSHISATLLADQYLMSHLDDLQIVARVKEPYSFWKKLLKSRSKSAMPVPTDRKEVALCSSRTIAQVNDGVALRVIIKAKKLSPNETVGATRARENMLCYYVQNLIRQQWPETEPGRVKDYIMHPKPNGYQSLHHTSKILLVRRGVEFPFEVQVRSEDMHHLAEFGVAAHWDYKLGAERLPLKGTETSLPRASSSTAVSIASPTRKGANSYVEALVVAQEELSKKHVYVFVVGGGKNRDYGELVSVPLDSPICLIAAEVEGTFSGKVQVWRNGRIAPTHDTLENGDVVFIAI